MLSRNDEADRIVYKKRVQTMPDRTAQELEVVIKIMDELVQEIGAMDMDNPERAKRTEELRVLKDVSVSLTQKQET